MVANRITSLQLSMLEQPTNVFTSPRIDGFAEDLQYEVGLFIRAFHSALIQFSVCVSISMSMVLMAQGADRHTKDFNRK